MELPGRSISLDLCGVWGRKNDMLTTRIQEVPPPHLALGLEDDEPVVKLLHSDRIPHLARPRHLNLSNDGEDEVQQSALKFEMKVPSVDVIPLAESRRDTAERDVVQHRARAAEKVNPGKVHRGDSQYL
jgi:hypothetical protein